MRAFRALPRQSYVVAAVALAATGTALAINPAAQADVPEGQRAADMAAVSVPVANSNTDDITATREGHKELTEFASHNSDELTGAGKGRLKAKRSAVRAADLRGDYRVLEVDMSKVASQLNLPASVCEGRDSEVLVAPQSVTNITYTVNDGETGMPLDSDEAPDRPDRCDLSVEWEEAPEADDAVQDDPEEASQGSSFKAAAATRPYAKKIAGNCFRRKVAGTKWVDGSKISTAFNDSCYQNWVEKYDGNKSWNFYSKRAMSTCDSYGNFAIKSCGHGVKRNPSGPKVYWQDWAPIASQDRNDCRARSASVTLWKVSVAANFDVCDKQLIYKYSEAGKMSSYWKGSARSSRGTQHQVAVKVGQHNGRPKWKHWTNVSWGV
ncbi:hypothetical protein GCM10010252_38100 [Streptomyces aureoverticillatus]|nr:hypothetical protein GCM10010252_38100 [Streptomyces aureoverticillatus]